MRWAEIQRRGMTADLSWRGAALRYEEEYRAAIARRRPVP
jgi:glycogen synthase